MPNLIGPNPIPFDCSTFWAHGLLMASNLKKVKKNTTKEAIFGQKRIKTGNK
ncbi:hypothetical protein ES703_21653 [subsurface metagenome]